MPPPCCHAATLSPKSRLTIAAEKACYVYLFDADSTGEVAILFPNEQTGTRHNYISGNSTILFPSDASWEIALSNDVDWEEFSLLGAVQPRMHGCVRAHVCMQQARTYTRTLARLQASHIRSSSTG